ncbi:hypothetical protein HKD42_09915 [Altererythrobacter sp. RZ02]|uniref:DUF2867 domain-containing protein n=1 Tax=Pontixanthobacter rizhaonensis TaxID=2730337 RepID=A0A848QS95_9SPHN|nr:hypothetical protein [Pontixanthobacter rizhaonensis]NMW32376.1 hypothetical protein [Pontixanthobacter rizhaonensis]
MRITERPLPADSLLALHNPPAAYHDCFTADVAGAVTLPEYITAFYNSAAFRPERWALRLIGAKLPGGLGAVEVAALASGEANTFAAWSVEARTDTEILLRDFQGRTCSWLKAEPLASDAPTIARTTRLYFGSGVRQPDTPIFKILMPVHRWYAKALLRSAIG